MMKEAKRAVAQWLVQASRPPQGILLAPQVVGVDSAELSAMSVDPELLSYSLPMNAKNTDVLSLVWEVERS